VSLRSCDSETKKISVSTGARYQVMGTREERIGNLVVAVVANLELAEQVVIRAVQSGIWYQLSIVETTKD